MHVPMRCPSLSTIKNYLPIGEAASTDQLRLCGWRQSSIVSCKCSKIDRVTRNCLEGNADCFAEVSPYGAQKRVVAERRVFVRADKRARAVVGLKHSGKRIEDENRRVPNSYSGEAGIGEFTSDIR